MDNVCKICNQEFSERSHFWKSHKIKEADYYLKYCPKHDLLTKEQITFKNPEQYFLTDFNDKRNLRKYLESISNEDGLSYLKNWLLKRKENKKIEFAPGEFEAKTLMMPSLTYWNKKYGINTYKQICLELKLQLSYDFDYSLYFKTYLKQIFLCDTREQVPLKLKDMEVQKLDIGDYTLEGSKIYIERKSLSDAISTLSGGYERFIKEIERCKNDNNYLIILIEEKYSNLQSFEYMPHIHSKCDWTFISHRIRELLQNYPLNIQFLAVDGRKEAVKIIEKIFHIENDIRNLDLQYLYNKGDL
jgi:hypothetical protein